MVFARRRYYFWLAQAYIKKWRRTIFWSFIFGTIIFFTSVFILNFYLKPFLEKKVTKIGYTGLYNPSSIPEKIWEDVSYGLTAIDKSGQARPAAAESWDVKNGGKTYVFHIRKGQYFDNGDELTSQNLPLEFKDVKKSTPDLYTVEYTLKAQYAPFFVSVSKPIFLKNFAGLGAFRFKKVDLSAGFVKSLTLQKKDDPSVKKIIYFYPTQEALKTAYMLGEVDTIHGVSNLTLHEKDLSVWEKTSITKETNYSVLVTLFYNNNDSDLSNKKLRQALDYALPATFSQGERAHSPIPPASIYFRNRGYIISDVEIAKTLLASAQFSNKRVLEIFTTEELKDVALDIEKAWDKIGVHTKVTVIDQIPNDFTILLYPFSIPRDPDQYTLWHSEGVNNIANYRKNKRIDKLLEDGRITLDSEKRKSIYDDFQKYLLDDVPASFLYFPYEYTVMRM